MVPAIGAFVWIEFEQGRVERPIYVGGFYSDVDAPKATDGSPAEEYSDAQQRSETTPLHAAGYPDGSDYDGSSRGWSGVPRTSFAGSYPNVRRLESPGGHVIELDDTPGSERVMISHRAGAFVEMLPDGSIVIATDGRIVERSAGALETVEGSARRTVRGSVTEEISGDYVVNVGGTYRITYGGGVEVSKPSETSQISGDQVTNVDGSWKVEALNNASLQAGGSLALGAMGNLDIQAGGAGSIVYSNSLNPVTPNLPTLDIIAQSGKLTLASTDPTATLAKFGIEIQGQGLPSLTGLPNVASAGPHVFLGNLLAPPTYTTQTPLVFEPAVLGLQLQLYLAELHSFLTAWLTDYIAHAHPWYSPAYTAAVSGPLLTAQFSALGAKYLTPTSPNAHPLLVSDVVFLGKQ